MARVCCVAVLMLGVITIMFAGCTCNTVPEDVKAALDKAGDNRAELQKVIDHYQDSADSLKLKAAYFLIGNMEGHSYVTYRMFDTAKATVELDVLAYPDYKTLIAALDTIEDARGELDYERDTVIEDLEVITADYLIENIDLTFEAWKTRPWAASLSFDDLCRYVLPYRGSNEPLEDWRMYFIKKYAGIDTTLANPKSALEAAAAINRDVRTWFGFDERYYLHPTDQGLAEMLRTGLGRCEDMTNMSIYAMRANGLAVTSDYTPYWANCGNNHAWNAILADDGKVVPFMGAEADPGEYALANKAAKVYRKTYHQVPEDLAFQPHKQDKIPAWLAGKNYLDVTADYYDVCDVSVKVDSAVPDSIDIAYLCVFNSGEFKPIQWGRIAGDSVTFKAMNTGILYLSAFYLNEEIVPCGAPMLLLPEKVQVELHVDTTKPIALTIGNVPTRAMAASSETAIHSPLESGTEYELFYWEDGWQSMGRQTAANDSVRYENIPSKGLYRLVVVDGDDEERPFTIEDGEQRFW